MLQRRTALAHLSVLAAASVLALASPAAQADIHIGVILSLTGPGASLGIPEQQAIKLWPDQLAGQKVTFTILNDNTDTTTAAQNARKLITEAKVDAIIGASLTPTSLAIVQEAGTAKVPVISLAGGGAIVNPQEGPRKWAFKLSPTETISATMVMQHMQSKGAASMATIGIATSYGEGFLSATEGIASAKKIRIVASERYNQSDQSVTAQVVKIIAANPDAVYIFSAGTAGALPHSELVKRGYKGLIYQTQGVANNDFLRVGGKELEGSFMTVAPVLVSEQLPDSNPTKKPGLEFLKRFEGAYGPGSRSLFAGTAWDALLLMQQAATASLKKAQPGTPEFRSALRDALESTSQFVASQAVYNMTPNDHNGVDQRSQVMVRIDKSGWKLMP